MAHGLSDLCACEFVTCFLLFRLVQCNVVCVYVMLINCVITRVHINTIIMYHLNNSNY